MDSIVPDISSLVGITSEDGAIEHVGMRKLCIRTLRKDGDLAGFDTSAYCYFCLHLLMCVSGKRFFPSKSVHKKISDFVEVSDEAYALLVLENSWDRMKDDAEHPERKARVGNIPTKYTMQLQNNRKFKGWSDAGKIRFNELCGQIENDRASEEGLEFELLFLHFKRTGNANAQDKRHHDSQSGRAEETVIITYSALGAKRKRDEEAAQINACEETDQEEEAEWLGKTAIV